MILAYDMLKDRRTIDVIISKLFPLAESLENLDILSDWSKDKAQKGLVEVLDRYENQEEERKSRFVYRRNTRTVSVGSQASDALSLRV